MGRGFPDNIRATLRILNIQTTCDSSIMIKELSQDIVLLNLLLRLNNA